MAEQPPREWLYPPTLSDAARVQRDLALRVRFEDDFGDVRRVAGADMSNNPRDPTDTIIHAVVVSLDGSTLAPVEAGEASIEAPMPYVPGFLGFREAPALVAAFARLAVAPGLIMVDGHGISHPRGLGIASHLGVLLDVPTIGVAKSILVGRPERELGSLAGDHVPLVWRGRTLGAVLRTRARVQPVYVSTGHRVSLASAIEWVLRCQTKYRLPEPTRRAHEAANALRRAAGSPTLFPHTD